MPDIATMSRADFETLQMETLDTIRQIHGAGVQRDFTTALGDINYDLQKPAKSIVPFVFSLAGLIPRVPGNGDIQTHYKVFTGINTAGLEGGTPEGVRQLRIASALSDKTAAYKTIGLEDVITDEAVLASVGFEDARARLIMNLLYAGKLAEEKMSYGGNTSLALGTPTAPTNAAHTTGGSVTDSTVQVVRVVALTAAGYRNSSVAGGVPTQVTGTSPDGTAIAYGGGASAISSGTSTTAGTPGTNANSLGVSTPVVPGAVAYAWYWGATSAGATLGAITTLNSYLITTNTGAGTQRADATGRSTDYSQNAYAFDGLVTLAHANGVVTSLATGTPGTGTGLTTSGAGGITEVDTLLHTLYDTYQVSPRYIGLSSQELGNIYTKILGNGGSPLVRFNRDFGQGAELSAGAVLGSYLNQFVPGGGGQLMQMVLLPEAVKGTVLAFADRLPGQYFPGSNMGQLFEFHQQRDWYQEDWPRTTRQYSTGVYTREVLVHYFPQTLGIINNIANV